MDNNVKINSMIERYENMLNGFGHYTEPTFEGNIIKWIDTNLRIAIGKTDDMGVALCSHQAIINREFPEHFCRVCNTDLSVGNKARWNDFLVLRHPQCFKPICRNCGENNPDEFYIAFRKGLIKHEIMKERIKLDKILAKETEGEE